MTDIDSAMYHRRLNSRRRMLRWRIALLAAMVALSSTVLHSAFAGTPLPHLDTDDEAERTDGVKAEVKELVQKGIAAYRKGKYEEALNAMEHAWTLRHSVVVASLLADIEMKLGSYDKAAFYWDFVINNLAEGATKELAEARAGLEECEKRTGTIIVSMDPTYGEFELDGKATELSNPGGQIWVMPGSHTGMMTTPQGEVSPKQLFTAAAGESIRITLSLPRAPALTPIQPAITLEQSEPFRILPEKQAQTRTIIGIVGGSLTAVALGVAARQGIRRYRLGRDIDDTNAALSTLPSTSPCSTSQGTPPPACADLRSQLNQFNDATRTTNAFLAISAVFGLATATAYLLWPKESEAAATVQPQLSYEYQGLTLQGGF